MGMANIVGAIKAFDKIYYLSLVMTPAERLLGFGIHKARHRHIASTCLLNDLAILLKYLTVGFILPDLELLDFDIEFGFDLSYSWGDGNTMRTSLAVKLYDMIIWTYHFSQLLGEYSNII